MIGNGEEAYVISRVTDLFGNRPSVGKVVAVYPRDIDDKKLLVIG